MANPNKIVTPGDQTPISLADLDQLSDLVYKDPAKVMEQLQALEALERLKAKRTAAEKKAQEEANRLAAIQEQLQRDEERKERCPHRKQDGRLAIAGQKDRTGTAHWLCLVCNKNWHGEELPEYMRAYIDMETIGG